MPAALALPMTVRGRLNGFVLMGFKPRAEPYRPDEIALLGTVAQRVALDQESLRIVELERVSAAMQQEMLALRMENSGMKLALRQPVA